MIWIAQLTAETSFLMAVVGPLVLIGLGRASRSAHSPQQGSLAPVSKMLGLPLVWSTNRTRPDFRAYTGGAVMMCVALIAPLALIVPSGVGLLTSSQHVARVNTLSCLRAW